MSETLPPYVSTGESNSFAMRTIRMRKPTIIDQVIESNNFNGKPADNLLNLKREMKDGVIYDPFGIPSFRADGIDEESLRNWEQTIARYSGKSWFDIPFYFAEAYFYLRILLAVGYFDSRSSCFMKDPYDFLKERELFSKNGGVEIGRTIADSVETVKDFSERIVSLLYYSLWGNRIDLSLYYIAEKSKGRVITERGENILIDHSQKLSRLIVESKRIDIILDNTGLELVSDLITARHILKSSPGREVHLHAKKYPFYVSDAMIKDIDRAIAALMNDTDETLHRVGKDLQSFKKLKSLSFNDHFFWNSPLHFPDLPDDILREFSLSDIVLLKGDVNYRRLLSDRKWSPWDRMEEAAAYFPVTFATLRTMKSEVVVDLDEDLVARLSHCDPEWMVNGERGIIRVVEKTESKE